MQQKASVQKCKCLRRVSQAFALERKEKEKREENVGFHGFRIRDNHVQTVNLERTICKQSRKNGRFVYPDARNCAKYELRARKSRLRPHPADTACFRPPRREGQLLHGALVSLDHFLDHLTADGACLTGGEVAVVALAQIYADFPRRSFSS